ncbi:MAG TPA: hypothetical protein VFS05_07565 [Gemmatimonadaceae bacterium]|nr:hypothetical protein [Gemmatimonadaceae bacterium]
MHSARRPFVALGLVVAALAACERPAEQQRRDTTAVAPPAPPETAAAPVAEPTWDAGVGPALVVHDASGDETYVIGSPVGAPSGDTTDAASAIHGDTLDLFTPAGTVGRVIVTATSDREPQGARCTAWPSADLRATGAEPLPADWTVAFVSGTVRPLPLAPIESMASADSARLAAELTRLASAIPDSARSPFTGLPFVVRSAYRFSPARGRVAVVADLVRKLNLEASPLEEHTLLIAERDSAQPQSRLQTVYRERTSASEERVVSTEVLAAIEVAGDRRTELVLARVGYDSTAYALLERSPGGVWRLRWTSARGC